MFNVNFYSLIYKLKNNFNTLRHFFSIFIHEDASFKEENYLNKKYYYVSRYRKQTNTSVYSNTRQGLNQNFKHFI